MDLEDWTVIDEWFAAEGVDVPAEDNVEAAEDCIQSIDNFDHCEEDEEYNNMLFSTRLGQCDTNDDAVTPTSSSSSSATSFLISTPAQHPSNVYAQHPSNVYAQDSSSTPPQHSSNASAQDSRSTEQNSRSSSAEELNNASTWTGFKLVKDLDKNIRPSFQRNDHQTKSCHYCHAFAVKDRVNLSSYPDTRPGSLQIDPFCLLPTADDLEQLKKNLVTLASR